MSAANSAVLYVEDDAVIRELSATAMEDAGFEVVTAENGDAALEALDDDASPFCAIVTDVNLGPGADGWDVAKRARELDNVMPVIYVTGAAGGDWQDRGVRGSVIIGKPFAPVDLVRMLGRLVHRRPIS